MLRALMLALLPFALVACADDDSSIEAESTSAPIQNGPVVAEPAVVKAGERVDLRFPSEVQRGVCWYLSEREGSGWSEPVYFLVSGPPGYDNDRAPFWRSEAEVWECEDIGIVGPGPDPIVAPDTASGEHRLCTANTGDESYCTTIRVVP
jgi:hypothetical protein